jgi:hypothetical protein
MDLDILREAAKRPTTPGTSDRRVMATCPGVSMRRVCRVLGFPRARLRARAALAAAPPRLDAALAERIQQLIARYPTFGYRRLWTLLRLAQGLRVNRKAVYRVLKLKGWLVHQRKSSLFNQSTNVSPPDLIGCRIYEREY